MSWLKNICIFFLLLGLTAMPLQAADTIKEGEELGPDQCVEIALNNHPALISAGGRIMQSDARIGQARS